MLDKREHIGVRSTFKVARKDVERLSEKKSVTLCETPE